MFVATPFCALNVFFRYNRAAWPMEASAVDQTRLKSLKLLTRNNVIVNINNHDQSFRYRLASSLSDSRPSLSSRSSARLNSFVIIGFRGGRSIRLKNAEVIKAKPKIANDRPKPAVSSNKKPKKGGPTAASAWEMRMPKPRTVPRERRPK